MLSDPKLLSKWHSIEEALSDFLYSLTLAVLSRHGEIIVLEGYSRIYEEFEQKVKLNFGFP
jgi:hypothetical protein